MQQLRIVARGARAKILLHYRLSSRQNADDGSLAQLVEQRTFNPLVVGSNPTRPTIYIGSAARALTYLAALFRNCSAMRSATLPYLAGFTTCPARW
jgi:hypothetical protein